MARWGRVWLLGGLEAKAQGNGSRATRLLLPSSAHWGIISMSPLSCWWIKRRSDKSPEFRQIIDHDFTAPMC